MACRGCSSDGCSCSVIGDGVAIAVSGTGTPVTSPYVVTFSIEDALDAVTVDDATDCSVLDDPHVPVRLDDGSVYLVPLPCYEQLNGPLPGQAFAFTWDSATDGAPGSGQIQFDSGTYSSVTTVHVSETDIAGTDISEWLDALDDLTGYPKGMFKVYSRTDPTEWATFRVVSGAAGVAGVWDFTVVYVDHAGLFSDVVAGDIVLDFAPASEGALGGFNSVQTIVTVSAARTFALGDEGKYFRCGSGPYTLTVPANADEPFVTGIHMDIVQTAAGTITVAGDVGVTVNAAPGYDLNGQWASATLIKVGTDEWDLVGNLTA